MVQITWNFTGKIAAIFTFFEVLCKTTFEKRTQEEVSEMTEEEVFCLQVLDDAFILAQAQKNAQDDLLEALDTNETEM